MPGSPPTSRRLGHAVRVTRIVHAGRADTRAGIAERTGMSGSLVSRVVSELVELGVFAADTDTPADGPGRPTERLRLHPDGGCAVGTEYGPERLTLALVDANGAVRAHEALPTARYEASADGLAWLRERITGFAARHRPAAAPLQGVGVAFHDVVTADGRWTRKRAGSSGVAARDALERRLGVPVRIDDVSRAFADAEHRFGAGRGAPDMLYLFLGRDGIGSGIFVDGHLLRSSTGVCGEIGHVPVVADGGLCSCGNRGCLETVATHGALLDTMRTYLQRGVRSDLAPDADVGALFGAAAAGDKVAVLVIHDLARHLQSALCSAIGITGATTVVLGGDVRTSGPELPAALASALRRTLLEPLAHRTEVVYAELPPHAGAWGAAVGALDAAVASGSYVEAHLRPESPV